MTRDEAVALVQQILGFSTSLSSTIVTNLQQQQLKLELMPTKPWFLLSEVSYRPTTIGEPRMPLPSDFLDEYEEGCLYYLNSSNQPMKLTKDELDVLMLNYKEATSGAPEAYALAGNYFRLFPTPDAIYTLKMLYYKKGDTLSSGSIENQWLKYVPELLVGKAGTMIAASKRDWEAKKVFDSMIAENMVLLENQNEARKHNNFNMQMGGPH